MVPSVTLSDISRSSSHNWLKSYLSNRSFQSLLAPLPLPSYCHLVVFPEALSWVPFFSQSMSHQLLELYHLTVSINSTILTTHSCFSSFSPHLFLAVCAVSSGVFLPFTAGSFTLVLFLIQPKLKQFALAPIHDSNRSAT